MNTVRSTIGKTCICGVLLGSMVLLSGCGLFEGGMLTETYICSTPSYEAASTYDSAKEHRIVQDQSRKNTSEDNKNTVFHQTEVIVAQEQ